MIGRASVLDVYESSDLNVICPDQPGVEVKVLPGLNWEVERERDVDSTGVVADTRIINLLLSNAGKASLAVVRFSRKNRNVGHFDEILLGICIQVAVSAELDCTDTAGLDDLELSGGGGRRSESFEQSVDAHRRSLEKMKRKNGTNP